MSLNIARLGKGAGGGELREPSSTCLLGSALGCMALGSTGSSQGEGLRGHAADCTLWLRAGLCGSVSASRAEQPSSSLMSPMSEVGFKPSLRAIRVVLSSKDGWRMARASSPTQALCQHTPSCFEAAVCEGKQRSGAAVCTLMTWTLMIFGETPTGKTNALQWGHVMSWFRWVSPEVMPRSLVQFSTHQYVCHQRVSGDRGCHLPNKLLRASIINFLR